MGHRVELRVRWFFQPRFRQHFLAEKLCQRARVVPVGFLHALTDHFELARINYHYFAYQTLDRLSEMPRIAGCLHRDLVRARKTRLKLLQLFQIKRAHLFTTILVQITSCQTVTVQVYSDESHLWFPPVV